jgi:hypothetical protein
MRTTDPETTDWWQPRSLLVSFGIIEIGIRTNRQTSNTFGGVMCGIFKLIVFILGVLIVLISIGSVKNLCAYKHILYS